MKYKNCSVKLVSEKKDEVKQWIDKIKKEIIFTDVTAGQIYPCFFEMGGKEGKVTDYRVNVSFRSKASKNNIYFVMNRIKATPIKFN